MAKKNPIIQELRDMGVSDYERRKLREVIRELEENDYYEQIADLNQEVLGENVIPMTLSYETALRLLQYNVYGNIQDIIVEYKNAIKNVDQGTTTEIEDYLDRFANELQDIGIAVTKDDLRDIDLENIQYLYTEFRKYEAMGDNGGMYGTKRKIELELGRG